MGSERPPGPSDEVPDAITRKRPAALLCQRRQVGRTRPKRGRDRTVAAAARPVARRAVLLKRVSSGQGLDEDWRSLLRVDRAIGSLEEDKGEGRRRSENEM